MMKFRYDRTHVENVEEFYQALKNGYEFQKIDTSNEVKNKIYSYVMRNELTPLDMTVLGYCYYYGYGVANDFVKATEWYKKSADQRLDVAIEELKNFNIN